MTTTTLSKLHSTLVEQRRELRALPALRSVGTRVWDALVRVGERRAAAEAARYLELHGREPTGDLGKDLREIAALRGL